MASIALRSTSARSSDATYESSLKEEERSSVVASMSDDMWRHFTSLETGGLPQVRATGGGGGMLVASGLAGLRRSGRGRTPGRGDRGGRDGEEAWPRRGAREGGDD